MGTLYAVEGRGGVGQSNHPSSRDLWNELFHLLELTPRIEGEQSSSGLFVRVASMQQVVASLSALN